MDRITVTIAMDPELIKKQHERVLNDIKRGRCELRMVTNTELRNEFEKVLIEEYSNGTLPNNGIVQLVEHQLSMLKIGERTMDMIPEPLKDTIKTLLIHGIQADSFKGGFCRGRAF